MSTLRYITLQSKGFQHYSRWHASIYLQAKGFCTSKDARSAPVVPPTRKRKYIIIGGGSAGCALAGRLLYNDKTADVTIYEAGSSNDVKEIHDQAHSGSLPPTQYNWKDVTQPQMYGGQRMIPYHTGKVLGGGGSINGTLWIRGHDEDFKEWVAATEPPNLSTSHSKQGNSPWAPSNMTSLFEAIEQPRDTDQPKTNPNEDLRREIPDFHITTTKVCYPMATELIERFNDGISPSDSRQPISSSLNYPIFNVLKKAFYYRLDAYTAFLTNFQGQKDTSPTAKINLRTRVLKLKIEKTDANKYKVTGIEVAREHPPVEKSDGSATSLPSELSTETIVCDDDTVVCLCAGAIRTPQILLLSGVGDEKDLQESNIVCQVPLKEVGKQLHDQVSVSILYKVDQTKLKNHATPFTSTHDLLHMEGLDLANNDYIVSVPSLNALLTKSPSQLINTTVVNGFFQTRKRSNDRPDYQIQSFFAKIPKKSSSGVSSSDTHSKFDLFFGLAVIKARPRSRGTVGLLSDSPLETPAIDLGIFQDDEVVKLGEESDMATLRTALRKTRLKMYQILDSNKPEWLLDEVNPNFNVMNDAEAESYIRSYVTSYMHPTSTCRMGFSENNGVVDAKLNVFKFTNLKIADASVMPSVTSGNTNATAMIIGVQCADFINGTNSRP